MMRRGMVFVVGLVLAMTAGSASAYRVYGAVDAGGNVVAGFREILLPESEGLRAAWQGSRCGYLGTDGQWVLYPKYAGCLPFVNGRAVVWDERMQVRAIDRSGQESADVPPSPGEFQWWNTTSLPDRFVISRERNGPDYRAVVTADMRLLVEAGPSLKGDETRLSVAEGGILEYEETYNGGAVILRVHALDGTLLLDKPMSSGVQPVLANFWPAGERYVEERGFFRDLALRYDDATSRYGYIDRAGNWAIPPAFVDARAFRDEVTLVATDVDYKKGRLSGMLINTRGEKVGRLPKAYCYSTPENGRIFALVQMALNEYRGVLLDYKGNEIAEIPFRECRVRTPWLNDKVMVIGDLLVSADGKVLQDGKGALRYERISHVERGTGLAIVEADSSYAAGNAAETGRLQAARRAEKDAFMNATLLRPAGQEWLEYLREPAFTRYWGVRIYKQGDYLYQIMTEIRARAGRSVQDIDRVAAVAGCRPPADWLLVKKGFVFPADPKDPVTKMDKQFAKFRKAALGGADLHVNEVDGVCQHFLLVDGPMQ